MQQLDSLRHVSDWRRPGRLNVNMRTTKPALTCSLALITVGFAACAGASHPVAPAASYQDLRAYRVANLLPLAPARDVIDELMGRVIDLQGRRWIGVEPSRDPGPSELAVFIVDAHRMAEQGCNDPLSPSCRAGLATADSCAALDDGVITCDARFLAVFENEALDLASPNSILRSAAGVLDVTSPDSILRSVADALDAASRGDHSAVGAIQREKDRFHDRAYRADLGEQLGQLRSKMESATVDRTILTAELSTAFELILSHEVAHIILGHVRDRMTVLRPSSSPGLGEDLETAADELAVRQILRRHDPRYLFHALFTLVDIADHAGWLRSRVFHLPSSGPPVDPEHLPVNDARFSVLMASVCENTHGLPWARIVRMASVPEAAQAFTTLPHAFAELLELVKESAAQHASFCDRHRRTVRQVAVSRSAPFTVTIQDAGALPRSPIRYRFAEGTTQDVKITTTTTTTASDGVAKPTTTTTTRSTTVRVEVLHVEPDGAAMVASGLAHSEDAALAGRFVSVVEIVNDRGLTGPERVLTRAPADAPWRLASPAEAKYFRDASSITDLYPAIVALPGEPVGAGAIWTTSGGGSLGTTTARLVSRTGDRLVIESSSRDSLGADDRDDRVRSTGTTSYEVDLGLPAAVRMKDEFSVVASSADTRFQLTTIHSSTRETVP